jgi:hypothetical protein
MSGLIRKSLGLILLIATVGLTTCQSMVKTMTVDSPNVEVNKEDEAP